MARKHHIMHITIYTKIYTFKPSMHTYACTYNKTLRTVVYVLYVCSINNYWKIRFWQNHFTCTLGKETGSCSIIHSWSIC